MDTIPPLSVDLIEKLDEHYKPISPNDVLVLSEKELAIRAGARAVVDFLLMRVTQDQQEDILNV